VPASTLGQLLGDGTLVSMLIGWILYIRAKGRENAGQD